jgi:hypothetical protein
MTYQIIKKQSVVTPSFGGTLKEGLVGEPNIFNPLLSVRDEDQEIVSLVFAGLMRKENNIYINDLAENISKSKALSLNGKFSPKPKTDGRSVINGAQCLSRVWEYASTSTLALKYGLPPEPTSNTSEPFGTGQ